jgi:uncharacterized membrane protein YcaP (DUF421 family)
MLDYLFSIDWEALFFPSLPLLEIILRGTVTYLALFTMLRVVLRREAGSLSTSDLLVVVLIATAVERALSGEYTSITDGLILVAVILFWDFILDWLGYRLPIFHRFVHPAPLKLIENGRYLLRNMRREFITHDELNAHLRKKGVEDVSEVKMAHMEEDGTISVIKKDDASVNEDSESGRPDDKGG